MALAVLGGGSIAVAALSTGGGGRAGASHPASSSRASSTTTPVLPSLADTPTSETRTAPTPTAIGTYQVASTTMVLVEPKASAPSRQLPTTVWFPAVTGAGGVVPDRAQAPYPLVVFSQGYDISVSTFATLIEDWASAGFVVAGPTYPHTDPAEPAGLNENDIVNHPADLRFVITSVLGQSRAAQSPLAGMIDAGRIGLVGHSDGGDVSLVVADNSCCQDARVKAVVVLSGAELASFGGTYFTGYQVPLLVAQGTADTINPPGCSVRVYDAAEAPRYYLDLLGAGHAPPYVDAGPDQAVIARVTTDFFDAELAGQRAGVAAMSGAGNVAGSTQLTDAASAPEPPGSCPGAPG